MSEERNTITVLVVEPMKEPYTKEIGSDYKDMQKEVGGLIQAIYPYDDWSELYVMMRARLTACP